MGKEKPHSSEVPRITIQRYSPSEIRNHPEFYNDLRSLMRDGYGFTEDLDEQVQHEYDGDNERRKIFLAFDNNKIVGSLAVTAIHQNNLPRNEFIEHLQMISRDAAEACRDKSIYNVSGVVVHPQFQGEGIAKQLLTEFVNSLDPTIVVGRTKTPAAAFIRARTLAEHGFRTWLGNTEITPEGMSENLTLIDIQDVYQAYFLYKNSVAGSFGEMYVPEDTLQSSIPDISRFSESIQIAYSPIITAQTQENQLAIEENRARRTAVLPLIAIKARS